MAIGCTMPLFRQAATDHPLSVDQAAPSNPPVSTRGKASIEAPSKTASSMAAAAASSSAMLDNADPSNPPPPDALNASRPAVVAVLSALLSRTAQTADARGPQPYEDLTKFHALEAPAISVADYVARVAKYAFCSNAALLIAYRYVERVAAIDPRCMISSLSCHRLFITAIVLAAKFHDDVSYNLEYYGRVGGLPVPELAALECSMLSKLDYRLSVSVEEFASLERRLVKTLQAMADLHANTSNASDPISNAVRECRALKLFNVPADPECGSPMSTPSCASPSIPCTSTSEVTHDEKMNHHCSNNTHHFSPHDVASSSSARSHSIEHGANPSLSNPPAKMCVIRPSEKSTSRKLVSPTTPSTERRTTDPQAVTTAAPDVVSSCGAQSAGQGDDVSCGQHTHASRMLPQRRAMCIHRAVAAVQACADLRHGDASPVSPPNGLVQCVRGAPAPSCHQTHSKAEHNTTVCDFRGDDSLRETSDLPLPKRADSVGSVVSVVSGDTGR